MLYVWFYFSTKIWCVYFPLKNQHEGLKRLYETMMLLLGCSLCSSSFSFPFWRSEDSPWCCKLWSVCVCVCVAEDDDLSAIFFVSIFCSISPSGFPFMEHIIILPWGSQSISQVLLAINENARCYNSAVSQNWREIGVSLISKSWERIRRRETTDVISSTMSSA